MYENNGVRYSVVHGTGMPDKEGLIIGLYPSNTADYEVRVDYRNTEYSERDAIAALRHYFGAVRGYPKMTLDIIINGRILQLSTGASEK